MNPKIEREFYSEPYSEILNSYDGREFYRMDGDLFFNGNRVHSEFPVIMSVPTTHHTTFRFNIPKYFSENSEKPKRELLKDIFGSLNRWLQSKHKGLPTGQNTVRYIWSVEYGATVEDEVHLHLLTHIHQGVKDLVMSDVSDFFLELEYDSPFGVSSTKTTTSYEQAGIVSYICKIEWDSMGRYRMDKKIRVSNGFQKVINRKFYKPEEMPEPFHIAVDPV
jgi:hypothetical protein